MCMRVLLQDRQYVLLLLRHDMVDLDGDLLVRALALPQEHLSEDALPNHFVAVLVVILKTTNH